MNECFYDSADMYMRNNIYVHTGITLSLSPFPQKLN